MNGIASSRRGAGFTLVEVTLVAGLVGMLAAISIPSLTKARVHSQMTMCESNLRLVEDAIDSALVANNFTSTMQLTVEMVGAYLKVGDVAALAWPREVVPPTTEIIRASETNGLYVIFMGERLASKRS